MDSFGAAKLTVLLLGLCLGSVSGIGRESRSQIGEQGRVVYGAVLERGTRDPSSARCVVLTRHDAGTLREVSATTDSAGRFLFSQLEPGRYSVHVVPEVLGHEIEEASFNGTQATWIDLTEGQRFGAYVTLFAVHYSIISGRVVNEDDHPIAGARISVFVPVFRDGSRRLEPGLTPGGPVLTDDSGQYRIPIPAGSYYLSVDELHRASASVPVSAGVVAVSPPQGTGRRYYPGVADLAKAQIINVPEGIEIPAINFRIEHTEEFFVRFELALDEQVREALDGTPVIDPLTIRFIDRSAGITSDFITTQRGPVYAIAPDTWLAGPVPPGQYEMVFAYDATAIGRGRPEMDHSRLNPILVMPVEIGEGDLDLGSVTRNFSQDIAGRVRTQFNRSGESFDLSALRPPQFREVSGSSFTEVAVATDEDGGFVLTGVSPGRYGLGTDGTWALPVGWFVASARSGGRDILNDGFEVGGSPVFPIEIVISNSTGRLRGTVRTVRDAPAAEADVILVPPTRGPLTRYLTTTTDGLGNFALADVPAGEYTVLALDKPEQSVVTAVATRYWEDPGFLIEYLPRGERVVIHATFESALDLELIRRR
jgi:hypothetical protein